MINTTTTCRCGGEKKERLQWCLPCWESLSEKERANYMFGIGALHAAISRCELGLTIDKQQKEQPCL